MVDKNLFRYDLAIVAIMKCEAPYLKEWLDYHLLAGVDHFFIFDNDSPDNQAEVVKPYVDAGLVDYLPCHGNAMQYVAYNDALDRFKFQCRYMAFIDGDEFIFPKSNQSIIEVVDEILAHDKNAAGLAINWQHFGSDGQEHADFSRGVLERFTKRAPSDWIANGFGNLVTKVIFNPRLVDFVENCHYAKFFAGFHSISETGKVAGGCFHKPISAEKIVINHYHCKSWEEFAQRKVRGDVLKCFNDKYNRARFDRYDQNQIFDDGILKYREARSKLSPPHDSDKRLFSDIVADALSAFVPSTNQTETLLTCLFDCLYLNSPRLTEQALNAIYNALSDKPSLIDIQLFIRALPDILPLHFPIVADLRNLAFKLVPRLADSVRFQNQWQHFSALNYLQRLLERR